MNLVGPLDAGKQAEAGFLFVFIIGFPTSLFEERLNKPPMNIHPPSFSLKKEDKGPSISYSLMLLFLFLRERGFLFL